MAHELKMPQLAQSVVEGEITRWLVKEGDSVKEEQPIAEITTDKVDVELPAPAAGIVLKILVQQGNTVPVGTPIAFIGQPGEDWKSEGSTSSTTYSALTSSILGIGDERAAKPETAVAPPAQVVDESAVRAAPAIRKLAQELGVKLTTIRGSGPGGRITREDVQRASTSLASSAIDSSGDIEYIPFSGRRKQIAQHMVRSKTSIPHASCIEEIDCTELVQRREEHKKSLGSQGESLTYLPYIVCAAVHTLAKHPVLNSTLEEDKSRIAVKKFINIGIAADAPEGLIVPVIRNAAGKSLSEIAAEIQSLSTRARQNQLSPNDVQDSTFTISSTGGQAGLFSMGIINYPEVALLNFHRIQNRPAAVDGKISIRLLTYVTLTFDHRVCDGGEVTRFLGDLKQRLEHASEWAVL